MFTIINRKVLDQAYTELRHLQETLPASVSLDCENAAHELRTALDSLARYEAKGDSR